MGISNRQLDMSLKFQKDFKAGVTEAENNN